ncbi:MAG: hypothetical protein M0D55_17830 [Elusimicrobiota bacterium]|nr:MAG: hypothetical protein M0D55_17830 [Elusimicrobiota bacterium]
MRRSPAALVLAALLSACPARAQEVAAVLTSAAGPYQAAFESFQKALGRRVPFWRLPAPRPGSAARARVIVAFGGEAATQDYGEGAALIACMAPGLAGRLRHGERGR